MKVGRIMEKHIRNLGLDVVRSIAIILVLICHSSFFIQQVNFNILILCGVLGVEIFFVLSGFLIGKIIINGLVEEQSINSLGMFYIRRWFRTLPLYYLVLFLTSIINKVSIPHRNFVFMQNFNENALAFAPVTWSLSVEEWFYLLIPVILIIFLKLLAGKLEKKTIFFIVSIGLALTSFLLRFYVVLMYNPTWDFGVRKQVFLRMDAIMLGVILSGIKIYFRDMYKKVALSKLTMILSCIGFIIIGTLYIKYLGVGDLFDKSILAKIFVFSVIPLVCFFSISWLESNVYINEVFSKHKISKIFTFISRISYGIYLFHWCIFELLKNKVQGVQGLVIAITITLLLAWLVNQFYEIPIMNLRDKITFISKRKNISDV